ncbi:Zinc finger protein [Dirofilaria immitis]
MLLSSAMLPHLSAAFRNGNLGTLDAETDQSPSTSGNIQKRIQYGLMSNLSGNGLSSVANPGDIINIADADNNDTTDQTDLIEAITFASLYGFQAVPIRIKILLHRALSTLTRKRAEAIIRRTGWKIDDFERGFIQEKNIYCIELIKEMDTSFRSGLLHFTSRIDQEMGKIRRYFITQIFTTFLNYRKLIGSSI